MAGMRPDVDELTIGTAVRLVEEAHERLQAFIDDVPAWLGRADEAIERIDALGAEHNTALEQALSFASLIRPALLDLQRNAVASRDELDKFVIS